MNNISATAWEVGIIVISLNILQIFNYWTVKERGMKGELSGNAVDFQS